jgi:hypothetical protein
MAVLTLDSRRQVVQINDNEKEILPFYELVKKGVTGSKKVHRNGHDFAIGQVDTINESYKLKIRLYYEKKTDSVILDCEIGERRTIISNRVFERYSNVAFDVSDGEIKSVCAYEL